uniref:Uncharacterized protein n=1 Tax=Amphimedon queenslandica TaxID=400682 RepID=A0A1X7TX92_AMPQE
MCCTLPLKRDEFVRLIFPYAKRKGNNTVMFGFILSKYYINVLYLLIMGIICMAIWTFPSNIFLMLINTPNPHEATSISFGCYADQKKAKICFEFNYNFPGALNETTQALTFGWIVTSILTWIVLNVNDKVIQRIKNSNTGNSEINLQRYQCWLNRGNFIIRAAIITPVFIMAFKWLIYDEKELLLYIITPKYNLILMMISTAFTLDTKIRKEPESSYKGTILRQIEEAERGQPMEMKHTMIKEMAKMKCIRLLAREAAAGLDEREVENIVITTFNEIMESHREEESTT